MSAHRPRDRTILFPRSYPWIILSNDYRPDVPSGSGGIDLSPSSTTGAPRPRQLSPLEVGAGQMAGILEGFGDQAVRGVEQTAATLTGGDAGGAGGSRRRDGRVLGLPRCLPFRLPQRLRPRRLSQRLCPLQLPQRLSQRLQLPQRLPQRLPQCLRQQLLITRSWLRQGNLSAPRRVL